ncbi:MAG: arylformamidase [Blastocatellia bacterium]|nr:arylformamidase [Blastocatellia bacterium]
MVSLSLTGFAFVLPHFTFIFAAETQSHTMTIYDISVPIRSGMPIYEGDPGVEIKAWSALSKGDSANVSFLNFGAHTGTHVDAPAHFIAGARKIDALSLESLIGPARVIRVPDESAVIDLEFLSGCDLDQVERVLFHTRNSSLWSEGFRKDYTHLAPEAAERLVELGVKLVGTDYLSIEKFHSGHHRTHLALLSQNVIIVEGLDLSEVEAGDYELICLPLKIADGAGDGSPARAVLRTL